MREKQKMNPRIKRRQAMKARRTLGTLAALVAIGLAPASMAGESAPKWDGDGVIEAGEDETAELARAAQNPVANMYSLPFQNNTNELSFRSYLCRISAAGRPIGRSGQSR